MYCIHRLNCITSTYNIVITPVSLTTIWTFPILIPNMGAGGHVPLPSGCAFGLAWTSLRYVVLLLRPLGPIRRTAPFYFSQTYIFIISTGHDGFHAFLIVIFLVFTNVTFQPEYYYNRNNQQRNNCKYILPNHIDHAVPLSQG